MVAEVSSLTREVHRVIKCTIYIEVELCTCTNECEVIPLVLVKELLTVHLRTLSLNLQTVTLDRSITEASINLATIVTPCTKECLVVKFAKTLTELAHVHVHLDSPL